MSSWLPAGTPIRQLFVMAGLLIGTLLASSAATADDYAAQWGPQIGSQLPVLEAYDQAGTLRTLKNLSGERGLLLFLSRSADW